MRRLLVVALALAALPHVAASEPYVVLLDWQEGRELLGTSALAMSPLGPRFALELGACHRTILLDLLYDPAELAVDAEGVGEAALLYDWLVELAHDDDVVAQARVRSPGYGIPLATVEEAGAHEVRLSLANGADVSWQLRVRGRAIPGEIACEPPILVSEVESNPAGADAGAEWVELHNAGEEGRDLGGMLLRATHGDPEELELPSGTWLGPGERIVITFPGQFLDNTDETVELFDPLFGVRDRTPALSDAADDARTWQRGPEGWGFSTGTPNG